MAFVTSDGQMDLRLLSEALTALHQYVWLYLPASKQYLYTSPALQELIALGSQSAKSWLQAVHPDDRETLLAALKQLEADGQAMVIEHRMLTAQAHTRWMQASIRLYTSFSGEQIQAGVLVDISARKTAQQHVTSSDQRFKQIFAHLNEALLISRPDGTILMANPAATRLFGYSEAELTAHGRALILDEQNQAYQQHHQHWQSGTAAVSVLTFKRRSGDSFQAQASSVPFRLPDGDLQLASLVRDLSQELIFSQRARQLYEISEAMPGAVYQFCLSPEGKIHFPFISSSAEHQWGYTVDVFNTLSEGFLEIVHPDDREALIKSTAESARHLSPWLMKFRGWDFNQQRYRWIRGHTIPSRQVDGSTLWNGTLLDIDEAEKNLLALEAQKRQLQAILDSMGEGLTVVDHNKRIQLINASGKALLGTGPTSASVDEWPQIYGLYLPDGVTPCPPAELPILRAFRGEQVRNCELWLQTPDGRRHYLLFSSSALLNEQGEISGAVSVYRDITALYLTEQRLRQTSERMKDLLERFNLGYMALNADWQIRFFNRAAWELSGRMDPEQLNNQAFWQLFPAAADPSLKFRAAYERALREGQEVHFSEFYSPLDSWFDIKVYPYQGELDLFFEDVTFTWRSQALAELEKELLGVQMRMNVGPEQVLLAALEGLERIFCSRRCLLLRMADWGPELPWALGSEQAFAEKTVLEHLALPLDLPDWIDRHAGTLWTREQAEGYVQELMQRTGYGKVRLLPIPARTGSLLGILVVLYTENNGTAHPQEPAGLAHGTMLLRNVLEVWLADWRLRLSQERYALASRATSDVIWDDDLRSGRLTFNQALCEHFGYPESCLITSHQWWQDRLHPDDRKRVITGWEQAIADGLQRWEDEYRFQTADREYRHIYDRGYIVYTSSGEPLRMIGSMQDVTTLRIHERRIQQQNEHLLQIAWQQSHQVRRPLANLLGLIQLLQSGPYPQDKLMLIQHEAQALDRIIANIIRHSEQVLDQAADIQTDQLEDHPGKL